MAEQEPIKRVEFIIESLQLRTALGMVERAGATGYTVIPHVYGKGHRGMRTELGFSDVLNNVLVIVIARASAAAAIAREVGRIVARSGGLLTVTAVEYCVGLNDGAGPT